MRRQTKLVLWATLSERTEQGRGLLRSMLRRQLLRRADRVIVNGASGERYVEQFRVPRWKIDRIPYAALPGFESVQHPPQAAAGIRNLLFAGQLSERKGLVSFVEALDRWSRAHPDSPLTLTVAGSGSVRSALEDFRPSGRVTIRLVGEQQPAALQALFAQTDAFCFPTLADEWGVVVNEALAAGVPVLGSVHSQAVEELCQDGVTGWLFVPENAASVQDALDRALATTPEELEEMRERARARVRTLTPDWTADRVLDTIRAVLSFNLPEP